jgi:uncharacterized protein
VMADTLDIALDRIFGTAGGNAAPRPQAQPPSSSSAAPNPSQPLPSQASLATQARDHYQRAMQAQRDGNWALYGDEIRQLGDTLREMSK